MKIHPILFTTPMVEAILDKTKTQTRRFVEPFFEDSLHLCRDGKAEYGEGTIVECPYGGIGDILWVRETFCLTQPKDPETYYFGYKCGANSHSDYPASEKYNYSIPDVWKPSIHMPKEACRIFLQITGLRVERLHDISANDAKSEGIKFVSDVAGWECYQRKDAIYPISPRRSFFYLFMSIYGMFKWEKNPWVWVIEFKRVEKPINF